MKSGLTLAAVLLCAATLDAQAHQMYRFHVGGTVLIKDHIPAELSHYGYEILNSQGQIIEVIAPAPSEEERALKKIKQDAERRQQQRVAEQRQLDKDLLRLYSRPQDVERARQRKVDEFDAYLLLQRRRIEDLEAKRERAQSQAANLERQGREVPADMREEIAETQIAIRTSEENMRTRQKEMDELSSEFAKQYERLRILQVYKPGTLPEEVDPKEVTQQLGR